MSNCFFVWCFGAESQYDSNFDLSKAAASVYSNWAWDSALLRVFAYLMMADIVAMETSLCDLLFLQAAINSYTEMTDGISLRSFLQRFEKKIVIKIFHHGLILSYQCTVTTLKPTTNSGSLTPCTHQDSLTNDIRRCICYISLSRKLGGCCRPLPCKECDDIVLVATLERKYHWFLQTQWYRHENYQIIKLFEYRFIEEDYFIR